MGDIFNRVVVILVENNVNSAHQSWVYVDLVDNIRKFVEKYSLQLHLIVHPPEDAALLPHDDHGAGPLPAQCVPT